MKLENQVCSLELAKKLKELGVRQYSLWWWAIADNGSQVSMNTIWLTYDRKFDIDGRPIMKLLYPAFTVAELGEMLPKKSLIFLYTHDHTWLCKYSNAFGKDSKRIEGNTEVNARAKMLIWLIEQGKVKV